MKRPLVAVVFAYGTGLLLAQFFHPPLLALVLSLLVILILALILIPGKHRKLVIWPMLALIGWTNLTARVTEHSTSNLRAVLGQSEPAIATVRGTLAETPRLKIIERKGQEAFRSVARLRVRELALAGNHQPVTGEILVTTPGVLGPEFFSGQPVEISGIISQPPGPLAEGLFDFRDYLATRGIYYQFKTESTHDWKLLDPHSVKPPLTDRFLTWSQQTLAMGLPGEDEPLRLLWAMTLGWRTAFTGDIDEPFLQAGTMHMFAIDGLRIALLSGMILALLRVLRLSRAWCGIVAIPVIWFYTAATGWEASAIRASVMMTIVLVGWMLKRPGDLLNSLAAAALVILAVDPRQLWEAGFQLSFFVMAVIALMLPPLNDFFQRTLIEWLKPDPLLADDLVPVWRKKVPVLAQRFVQFCGVSFAAWMGSLPLAAKYFHLFSPVSTLANLFAVPLGALALMANLGALICGAWLPWFTDLFNQAAWFLMVAMTWVSVKFAALPWAYFYVPEPSWFTIVIYYVVLLAALSGWFKTAQRIIPAVFVLLVIGAGYLWQWQTSRAETDLTILPLDGGHAVYVDAEGRQNDWLINCGSKEAVQFTVKDYLRGQGVNSLPRLVLADGNARNCSGAKPLNDLFGIGELWTSSSTFRSPAYREAVAATDDHGRPPNNHEPMMRHKVFKFGETNGCWQVLYPPGNGNVSRAGDAPLVLLGNFHGTRILLLSELSREGQSGLLSQTNDLHADIVIAGLPDEGEPLCTALLDAVKPGAIVIADSEFPATRRASHALHERLGATGIPIIYTRSAGAVKIIIGKAGWKLQATDGQKTSSDVSSGL